MADEQKDAEREVKFWDCNDGAEMLYATDIDDAIDRWAEDWLDDDDNEGQTLPETKTVYGFAVMVLPSAERIAGMVLDHLGELLDEDFGHQDGDPTEIPASVKDAALVFARVVKADYPVWSCECITEQTVRVRDYYTPDGEADSARTPQRNQ